MYGLSYALRVWANRKRVLTNRERILKLYARIVNVHRVYSKRAIYCMESLRSRFGSRRKKENQHVQNEVFFLEKKYT